MFLKLMKLFGILEGAAIIIIIASLAILVINGVDDPKKGIWTIILVLGILLWGFMCLPNNGKWNLPVRYSVLIELPGLVQLHGLILWIIIAVIVFLGIFYLLEEPIIDYDSYLGAFASVMVNVKMIGIYWKGGIRCITSIIHKNNGTYIQ